MFTTITPITIAIPAPIIHTKESLVGVVSNCLSGDKKSFSRLFSIGVISSKSTKYSLPVIEIMLEPDPVNSKVMK